MKSFITHTHTHTQPLLSDTMPCLEICKGLFFFFYLPTLPLWWTIEFIWEFGRRKWQRHKRKKRYRALKASREAKNKDQYLSVDQYTRGKVEKQILDISQKNQDKKDKKKNKGLYYYIQHTHTHTPIAIHIHYYCTYGSIESCIERAVCTKNIHHGSLWQQLSYWFSVNAGFNAEGTSQSESSDTTDEEQVWLTHNHITTLKRLYIYIYICFM